MQVLCLNIKCQCMYFLQDLEVRNLYSKGRKASSILEFLLINRLVYIGKFVGLFQYEEEKILKFTVYEIPCLFLAGVGKVLTVY